MNTLTKLTMQEEFDECVKDVEDITNQYLRSNRINREQMLGVGNIATRYIFDFDKKFGKEEAIKLGRVLYGLVEKVEDKYHKTHVAGEN